MTNWATLGVLPAALLLVSTLGCGGSMDATLTGHVTYQGEPLTTGTVTFQPDGKGPVGVGSIREDGSYEIVTGTEYGLPPGDYRVTVVANGPFPEPTPDNPEPLPTSLIPQRYTVKQTSELSFSVSAGGNEYDIDLVD